ncbi:MAG: ABC transporter permease [Thermoplasmata archaeon]|nr:ABC transporter permease [Thermoplasmata archaeon]
MSHITSIMKKELREMLTPGSVISVVIMVVLFAGLGMMINGEVEKAASLPTIGIVAEEDAAYYTYVDEEGVTQEWNPVDYLKYIYGDYSDRIVVLNVSTSATDSEIIEAMQSQGVTSAVVFPSASDFRASMDSDTAVTVKQLYVYQPTGMFGTVSTSAVTTVLSYVNSVMSSILIYEGGYDDYEFITNPVVYSTASTGTYVNGEVRTGISPDSITNTVTSQTLMIPLVIMIIIMMVGSIVISSMGSEKENKTLETLLTLPIKRTSIVAGKIIAAAIVGLAYGLAYLLGMSLYMGSMASMYSSTGTTVDLSSIGMALDLVDWFLVLVSMFLAIVCALGICMILGAFAKNYKSAQTMTMPLSILAMIPMFIIMFSGWYGAGTVLQAVCFIIPFSHPMIAMQALMYGDVTLVLEGVVYMAAFALVTILITVKLYSSDILITGLGQNKYFQKLTGRK